MQRYITDESGVRTAVILSVEESLEEMAALRDRTRETPTRLLEDVVADIERESDSLPD